MTVADVVREMRATSSAHKQWAMSHEASAQEAGVSTGFAAIIDKWANAIARAESAPLEGEVLTQEDIDQIIEGLEHFCIGPENTPDLEEIWQPYIDKLRRLPPTALGPEESK